MFLYDYWFSPGHHYCPSLLSSGYSFSGCCVCVFKKLLLGYIETDKEIREFDSFAGVSVFFLYISTDFLTLQGTLYFPLLSKGCLLLEPLVQKIVF